MRAQSTVAGFGDPSFASDYKAQPIKGEGDQIFNSITITVISSVSVGIMIFSVYSMYFVIR